MERPALLFVTGRGLAADAAYHLAVDTAAEREAPLTILHARRDEGGRGDDPLALERLVSGAEDRGVEAETLVVGRSGSWMRELDALTWARWSLAFKVAEPEDPLAWRLGWTLDERLARAPGMPVWFVPPTRGTRVRVVMAAVDVTRPGRRSITETTLQTASVLASAYAARLYVVHAWSLADDSILTASLRGMGASRAHRSVRWLRRSRRESLEGLAGRTGGGVPLMVRGRPDKALRRASRNVGADVIVVGTEARDGLAGLLWGNLAEALVRGGGPGVLVTKEGGTLPSPETGRVAA